MSEQSRDDVMQKLNTVFREVFDNEDISLSDKTTAADVEGWDSLTNIRVMIHIEQEFGISFNSADIADIPDVGGLVDLIVSRL